MARDQRTLQKTLRRKAAKRRQQRDRAAVALANGTQAFLERAGRWPLHAVLLSENWNEEAGNLVTVLVARRSPRDHVAMALFLVDLGCLGVKNAFVRVFDLPDDYEDWLQHTVLPVQTMISADLELAAKIIGEGVAFASYLGFAPHRDHEEAKLILGEVDAGLCTTPVRVGGENGRPSYISGPDDDVDRILAQLARYSDDDGLRSIVPAFSRGEDVAVDAAMVHSANDGGTS